MTKRYILGIITVAVVALIGQSAFAKLPSWDTVNNSKGRFKVLNQFNKEAVLDVETGLVWELDPSAPAALDWDQANTAGILRVINNRAGWRLPTIQELTSLVDTNTTAPALPPAHPFVEIAGAYWSATTRFGFGQDTAWTVGMNNGLPAQVSVDQAGPSAWCVRGPSSGGSDTQ